MLDLFLNSVQLFFVGKLFRDNRAVLRQWLKGFGVTLAVLLVLGLLVSPGVGVVVASLVGGYAQPRLFKDLKYA